MRVFVVRPKRVFGGGQLGRGNKSVRKVPGETGNLIPTQQGVLSRTRIAWEVDKGPTGRGGEAGGISGGIGLERQDRERKLHSPLFGRTFRTEF